MNDNADIDDPITWATTFPGTAPFDEMVQLVQQQVEFELKLLEPDGDLQPFAFFAEGPGVYQLRWSPEIGDIPSERFHDALPSLLASRDPHIIVLYLPMYLRPPGQDRFEAAGILVMATDWQNTRELSLAGPLTRTTDGVELEGWTIKDDHIAPAFANPLYEAMFGSRTDRGTSGDASESAELFRAFAEDAVPNNLEQVIEEICDEWDGSPLLLLAIPGQPDSLAYVLGASAGQELYQEIATTVADLELPPAAAALVFSAPLFTTQGQVPGEGMLSIICADDKARQSARCRRLSFQNGGKVVVDELPADVDGRILPGVTRWFIAEMLNVAGAIRDGTVEPGIARWEQVVDEALRRGGK